MNIEINPAEIINEMQEKFSKEFTICVQAIQIRKLAELVETDPAEEFDYEFESSEPNLEAVEDA